MIPVLTSSNHIRYDAVVHTGIGEATWNIVKKCESQVRFASRFIATVHALLSRFKNAGELVHPMTSREEVTLLVPLGKLFLCTPPILFIVNSNYTHWAQWADFPKLISCWSGDSNQQPSGHKPICDLSYSWLCPVSNQSAYPDLWPLKSTRHFRPHRHLRLYFIL